MMMKSTSKQKKKPFIINIKSLFLIRKHDEFLTENRHILYHMIDLRQTHIEEFNMLLILLIVIYAYFKI